MTEFDVCVVGGGIQGCGVAQAAAASGYSAVVLERSELAAATSSRSSKLIHGGLRYLESGQFALVARSIAERGRLLRNAPELVHLIPFYIPIYKQTLRRPWEIRIGLSMYAVLGRLHASACFRSVPVTQWSQLDGLRLDDLQAVYQYWDAQTDDHELTRAVMYSAMQLGAKLLCPAQFITAQRSKEGFRVEYEQSGRRHELYCKVLINAAGPWVGPVHESLQCGISLPALQLVQGAHLLLRQAAPHGCYYLESPSDRRAVFVMPWYGQTLIGTTETVIDSVPAQVEPNKHEVDYLYNLARFYFPHIDNSLVSQFAGVRVLPKTGKGVFHSSREAILFTHSSLPGYLALIGGKLTAYRSIAEEAMKRLRDILPTSKPLHNTRDLKFSRAPTSFETN